MKRQDITGHRFGRLVALSPTSIMFPSGREVGGWVVQCDCGTVKTATTANLVAGKQTSCGCWRKEKVAEKLTVHGAAGRNSTTTEYRIWQGMKQRCLNAKSKFYSCYGGRGIDICARWLNGESGQTGFECFLADMGCRPSDRVSLDRIDNDSGYSPENCRWATKSEQSLNRRKSRRHNFKHTDESRAKISAAATRQWERWRKERDGSRGQVQP